MKHKREMQKAHLGRCAGCRLVGSSSCYCQLPIQTIRHEARKTVLFRLAELSNQSLSHFMLLSLFPCSQNRKMLWLAPLHAGWELPGTGKYTENCEQVRPFGAGSQRVEAALSRFVCYGFVTERISSRSAGKYGFVPTKLKGQLLCSTSSSTAEPEPPWYHATERISLRPPPTPEALQRWGHFRQ